MEKLKIYRELIKRQELILDAISASVESGDNQALIANQARLDELNKVIDFIKS